MKNLGALSLSLVLVLGLSGVLAAQKTSTPDIDNTTSFVEELQRTYETELSGGGG